MNAKPLPTDIDDCHRLIATLQSQVEAGQKTKEQQAKDLQEQATALELKNKLVEQQAHSVLQLKADHDKLDEKVVDLTLRIEKLLQQLFGRKSERHVGDDPAQLRLDLGDEASPEVVSALEDRRPRRSAPSKISALDEAIREAEHVVAEAEEEQKRTKPKPPRKDNRKFPPHLPRIERIVDLPEHVREGLKLIGYDEVETLQWVRPELRVLLTKYAKCTYPADKSQGIVSPERPAGLVEGNRFDASVGVEVVAWKYFYHQPFYRQQGMFAGSGWTSSRSTLENIEMSVEFALRQLAEDLRSYLKTDQTVGCDDTGVILMMCCVTLKATC